MAFRVEFQVAWDVFIGVLIVYTIITLTWRIGFNQEALGVALAFEYSVDVLFAVDTVLCFRTGFYQEDVLVTDWAEIAKRCKAEAPGSGAAGRYCLSYFVFDFLSWFPIDLLVQVAERRCVASWRGLHGAERSQH